MDLDDKKIKKILKPAEDVGENASQSTRSIRRPLSKRQPIPLKSKFLSTGFVPRKIPRLHLRPATAVIKENHDDTSLQAITDVSNCCAAAVETPAPEAKENVVLPTASLDNDVIAGNENDAAIEAKETVVLPTASLDNPDKDNIADNQNDDAKNLPALEAKEIAIASIDYPDNDNIADDQNDEVEDEQAKKYDNERRERKRLKKLAKKKKKKKREKDDADEDNDCPSVVRDTMVVSAKAVVKKQEVPHQTESVLCTLQSLPIEKQAAIKVFEGEGESAPFQEAEEKEPKEPPSSKEPQEEVHPVLTFLTCQRCTFHNGLYQSYCSLCEARLRRPRRR